jgi:hypothetical protein
MKKGGREAKNAAQTKDSESPAESRFITDTAEAERSGMSGYYGAIRHSGGMILRTEYKGY